MSFSSEDIAVLLRENADLRARAYEAESALKALRRGDIDTLLAGEFQYTRDGADAFVQQLHRQVLMHMRDAVLAFDNDDRITFMNPAAERHYRRSAEDLLGRARTELYRELDAAAMDVTPGVPHVAGAARLPAAAAAHSDPTIPCRSIHVLGDGRRLEVMTTSHPLHADGTPLRGRVLIVHTAGEPLKPQVSAAATSDREAALEESNRRKDEFLATLSHELRNPLAPIRNALHIMQRSHDQAAQVSARNIIERQLQQLIRLVDDLLDVSRISRGKLQLRRETVDVATALQMALETSRPVIEGGRHELMLRPPPPGTVLVEADRLRLCQIIANLFNNAAKYTPEGGRIVVEAVAESNEAVISVQDSGVGIAPEMLPRIFDLFTQGDDSSSRSQGGLGIGLSLVKTLVEMHAGTVQAFSEGPGRGSRFVVRLPLLRQAPPTDYQSGVQV